SSPPTGWRGAGRSSGSSGSSSTWSASRCCWWRASTPRRSCTSSTAPSACWGWCRGSGSSAPRARRPSRPGSPTPSRRRSA
ncbi:MAG: Riboflavin transporter PnuX, partial [uncultured Friedmanniella sp.]